MKLNSFWCFLALFVSSFGLNAQTEIPTYEGGKFEYGESLPCKLLDLKSSQTLGLDGQFYFTYYKGKQFYGAHINSNLQIVSPKKQVQKLDFKINGKKAETENITVFGEKLCAFNAVYDGATKTKTLYLQEMSAENFGTVNSTREVVTVTKAKSKGNSGDFYFDISQDSSRMLVCADMPRKTREKSAFWLTVLNNQMDVEWSKEVEMPYTEELFDLQTFEFGQDGSLYIVGQVWKTKKTLYASTLTKRDTAPDYSYVIIKYNPKGEQVASTTIDLGNKFLPQPGLFYFGENDLRFVGLYNIQSIKLNIYGLEQGVFSVVLDENLSITKKNTEALGLANWSKEERLNQNKGAISVDRPSSIYIFRAMLANAGGSMQMVAETIDDAAFVIKTSTAGSAAVSHSYSSSLIIIDMDSIGDIKWYASVPKKEKITKPDYIKSEYRQRFIMLPTEEGIRFIFNDHKTTYEKKAAAMWAIRDISEGDFKSKGVISTSLMGEEGKKNRQVLPVDENQKGFLIPYAACKIGDKELIMPVYKANKLRFDRFLLP